LADKRAGYFPLPPICLKRRAMTNTIRPATRQDLTLIAQLIRDLAEYEKLSHEVRFDEATLERHLFGPHPMAEVVIGQIDGTPQGFASSFTISRPLKGAPASIWRISMSAPPRADRGWARRCCSIWPVWHRIAAAQGWNGAFWTGTNHPSDFTAALAQNRWNNGPSCALMAQLWLNSPLTDASVAG
jgi:hypothetical protein